MTAKIIILPVIRRECESESCTARSQEIKIKLEGDRLAKVKVIAFQLGGWPIETVVTHLLNVALDNLDSRILQARSK